MSCAVPTPTSPVLATATSEILLPTPTTFFANATLPITSAPASSATPGDAPAIRFAARDLVHDLQWSPDGSQLAISAGTNIYLYSSANPSTRPDGPSGQALDKRLTLHLSVWAERIAFHPSQPILGAAAKDGSLRFWDTASGAEICTFIAHRKGANSLAFQPSGNLLVTTGTEIISRMWDVSSVLAGGCDVREVASLIGSSYTAPDVTFSTDGQMFALVDIKDIYLRESQTRKLIAILKSDLSVFDIAISPDGRWLAAAQNNATLTLWDLTSKPAPVETILHLTAGQPQNYVWRVDFSSDSRLVAGAGSDGALLVWELPGMQPVFSHNLSHAISGLAFKPHTYLLAAASLAGSVYIYLVE